MENNDVEILYLSPEEVRAIDWTGAGFNWINAFPKEKSWPGKPSPYYNKDAAWFFDRYYANLRNLGLKHKPYVTYVNEMIDKVVQQGGQYSLKLMKEMCREYYINVPNSINPDKILFKAMDKLRRRIRFYIRRDGYPQDVPIKFGNTQGALPTFMLKSTYQAQAAYEKHQFHHIEPNIPGQRVQHKPRVIFMDSCGNYAHFQPLLAKCREWLKAHFPEDLDAWRNPNLSMKKRITKLLDRGFTSIELDYKRMDQWFCWELVRTFILPLYEELLTPGEYLIFASMAEEYFKQELFFGTELWCGEHTLFSGIPPTNDFETLWDWILSEALAILHPDYKLVSFKLGDDLSLLGKCTLTQASDLVKEAITLTCGVNLRLHEDEKNRIAQGDFRFLKQLYYLGGKRDWEGTLIGAYPGNILLRNVLLPEYSNNQTGIAAIADLQRCDGLVGSPDYAQTVDLLLSNTKHQFALITPEDVEAASEKDWWSKLYGESWDPRCSATYQHYFKLHPKEESEAIIKPHLTIY